MVEDGAGYDVAAILQRLSKRLSALAEEVCDVEHLMSAAVGNALPVGGSTITRLQKLDVIRQSLEDLSLLAHLASHMDRSEELSGLMANLRLEATRQVLTGYGGAEHAEKDEEGVGNIEIF